MWVGQPCPTSGAIVASVGARPSQPLCACRRLGVQATGDALLACSRATSQAAPGTAVMSTARVTAARAWPRPPGLAGRVLPADGSVPLAASEVNPGTCRRPAILCGTGSGWVRMGAPPAVPGVVQGDGRGALSPPRGW